MRSFWPLALVALVMGLFTTETVAQTSPLVISGGRPRIYVPGCLVPTLEFHVGSVADLPATCPRNYVAVLSTATPTGTLTDPTGQFPDECIAAMIPTSTHPNPPSGTFLTPHAQGTYTAVKNDTGRQRYFAATAARGQTVNNNQFRVFGYNYLYAPYQISQYTTAIADFQALVSNLRSLNGGSLVDVDAHSCGPQYLAWILDAIEATTPGWTVANIGAVINLSDDTFGEADIWEAVTLGAGAVFISTPSLDAELINGVTTLACFFTNYKYYADRQFIKINRATFKVSQLPSFLTQAGFGGFTQNWQQCADFQFLRTPLVSTEWFMPTNGVEPSFYTYVGRGSPAQLILAGPSSIAYLAGDDEQDGSTNVASASLIKEVVSNTVAPPFSLAVRTFADIATDDAVSDHHIAQLYDPNSLNARYLRGNTPVGA